MSSKPSRNGELNAVTRTMFEALFKALRGQLAFMEKRPASLPKSWPGAGISPCRLDRIDMGSRPIVQDRGGRPAGYDGFPPSGAALRFFRQT